jgi:oxepin-CoA hydrolase / 3-oxo-5,6-dehydrosuberyl-CoA semialdehyde dehydrogenase
LKKSATNKIENYVLGKWQAGDGEGTPQYNAFTGQIISTASSEGLDYGAMCKFAREKGGSALRKMNFHERGLMLKAMAFYLLERKDKYYPISHKTGVMRQDTWVDVEGGIGNLFAYASLRRKFPSESYCMDGNMERLSKENTFVGHHIMVPKRGVAIHINAFNFPVWGMLEKIAVNLLAGVPAIVKASEQTSFLTEAVVRDMVLSGIFPEGSLQVVMGSGQGILNHLTPQDVVTFTGSATTGKKLRVHPNIIKHSVPFNMEADSLNAIILGEDAEPGTAEFELFIKEVRREMTTKTGQKCTAVRRIIVPEKYLEDAQKTIIKALNKIKIGNPLTEGVRMGALINKQHQARVHENLRILSEKTPIISGDINNFEVVDFDREKGAFCPPILMLNEKPLVNKITHELECFGPVSTIMPYKSLESAIKIANLGKGSLVSTICTYDRDIARQYVLEAAAYHGRILILNQESGTESTGHGAPMPLLTHGGPGHAGGGEEMGGVRGVLHYMQRTAIQGHPSDITAISHQFQQGAEYNETEVHPFRKHFEDLEVGDTLITAKHTVSETDIHNFANVSGDNFYAHMDVTSLEDTPFTERVAHGYFILSKAAGLFVDAKKGPVLLNYGIEECRFTKPVYPGTTIGVRLTVKEKIAQDNNNPEQDVAKGIVKWLVDIYDQNDETVAIATILTMVKKRIQPSRTIKIDMSI